MVVWRVRSNEANNPVIHLVLSWTGIEGIERTQTHFETFLAHRTDHPFFGIPIHCEAMSRDSRVLSFLNSTAVCD